MNLRYSCCCCDTTIKVNKSAYDEGVKILKENGDSMRITGMVGICKDCNDRLCKNGYIVTKTGFVLVLHGEIGKFLIIYCGCDESHMCVQENKSKNK